MGVAKFEELQTPRDITRSETNIWSSYTRSTLNYILGPIWLEVDIVNDQIRIFCISTFFSDMHPTSGLHSFRGVYTLGYCSTKW